MLIIGYTVPKHKKEEQPHERYIKRRYSRENSLLLSVKQENGALYLTEGDEVSEIELSYNVMNEAYQSKEVTSVPYFMYKNNYYELNEFKSIGGKHRW